MKPIVYRRFGNDYRKLGRDEKIKEGALHSWNGGALRPVMNADTVGQTPADFSDERDFYNLMEGVRMPEVLKKFLEGLNDTDAEALWDYFDGDPGAIEEMIMVMIEAHPVLQALCTPADDKKLKEVV